MIDAWIGLGSNLEQPVRQLQTALDELDCLPESWLEDFSSLYVSAPMGPADQPDFVNAVAKVRTRLPPLALLDELQQIENAHGRVRARHWGPRTLDLDLLLYANQTIDEPRLQVPHPGMSQRAFVLLPLLECWPAAVIPGQGKVEDLINAISDQPVRKL